MSPATNFPIKEVRKRDGRMVSFERNRITNAVYRAMLATGEGNRERDPLRISDRVARELVKKYPKGGTPSIEEIQDIVEEALILMDFPKTAKSYILYRNERAQIREKTKTVPVHIQNFVRESKKYFRNALSEFIYYRTYSRWIDEENRRETWIETVDRYMSFMNENLGDKLKEEEYSEIREAILKQEAMPSMRLLWSAGRAARKTNVSAYNCSFIAPSKLEDFAEIMYLLMCGTGVGFSVESQNIQMLPIVKKQSGEKLGTNVIEDSKEGWGDALTLGLKTWYGGKDIDFDYSQLRPAGSRLATMGGQSSGPGPLKALLEFSRSKILSKQGRRMSNIDIHDIICKIGEVVVMGGVRRCLPQNTLIHTREGLKPIKEIKINDKVLTLQNRYRRVVTAEHTGLRNLLNIHTQLGIFRSTPEHRWAVLKDLDGNVEWVEAANLTPKHTLVHIPEIIPGRNTVLPFYQYLKPKFSTTTKDISIPRLDEDVAWLIGYFHGDGYVFRKNNTYGELMFACSPDMPATVNRLIKILSRFGVNAKIIEQKFDRSVRVRVKSNQLANYFYFFKQSRTSITVPDFILEGTPEIRAAYIAGAFDADGSVKSKNGKKVRPTIVSSVYIDWLRQLRAVLASIGVSADIKQNRPAKGAWQALYHINPISIEAIGRFGDIVNNNSEKWQNDASAMERKKEQNSFVIPKNLLAQSRYRRHFEHTYYVASSPVHLSFSKFAQTVMEASYQKSVVVSPASELPMVIAAAQPYWRPVKIKEITNSDSDETYDIQVEGDECFVAEGMLVHNSALISLSDLDDDEMRDAKTGQFYLTEPQRAMANNSAVYNEKPSATEFMEEWLALAKSGTGERGIFNRGGLAKQLPSRRWKTLKDHYLTSGTNPCVTSDTWVMTSSGAALARDLIGKPFEATIDGKIYKSSGFFETGEKEIFKVKTNRGFTLKATGNHKVLAIEYKTRKVQRNTWKEIKDLKPGDKIVLHNHRDFSWNGFGTEEEGWLLGNLIGDGNIEANGRANLDYWGETQLQMMEYAAELIHSAVGGRSDLRGHLAKSGYGRVGSTNLGFLALSYGLKHDRKFPTDLIEMTSSWFHQGFLRGWFDADGSVQGSQIKGVSVRLNSSFYESLERAQRMLARLGIISTVYKNRKSETLKLMPDGKGGAKEYLCRANHELIISGANLEVFARRVDFSDPIKKAKLGALLNVYKRKFNREPFSAEVIAVENAGREFVYDCQVPGVNAFDANGLYVHNCGEIVLRSKQFCNLSEVVSREDDTLESLLRKVRIAAILGTYQSALTNFPYISKEWKINCEEERLLGVSITGHWDSPEVQKPEILVKLREHALKINRQYAKRFEINESTCITCVKPSGTVSQLVDAASGMHPRHSKYYIRRVRISATDPLFEMLKEQKFPYWPEVGQSEQSATTFVLEFPVRAPASAKTKNDFSALDQLEYWKIVKENYTEHNPSVTVSVGPDEWIESANWLYKNWDMIGGLSFLPRQDHVYQLAPFEEISEEKYNDLISKTPEIDFSHIMIYEKEDQTQGAKELACVGGVCEIDLTEEMSQKQPVVAESVSVDSA